MTINKDVKLGVENNVPCGLQGLHVDLLSLMFESILNHTCFEVELGLGK